MSRTRFVPERESLTVEFKSDARRLPDGDLVAAAVCLANTEGGEIYLGVEADSSITGLHADHRDAVGISALVTNRTSPPLSVRVSLLTEAGHPVARIEVPKSARLVATSEGLVQRRLLQADGTPACVPFYPHEFAGRLSSVGQYDLTAQPVDGTTTDDLDPLERERLRQMIRRYGGDEALLGLTDDQLDGALGLVRSDGVGRVPTLLGLLLVGRELVLRERVPTHEAAFQVLEGTEVRVNTFWRWPLLKLFEEYTREFRARLEEHELQTGLFRVPVPSLDPRAFREALVNALIHRDYSRLGTVFVRLQPGDLSIGNPGGFVEGVTLENLLRVDPRSRNPALADAVKRIGIAERTGRGVDIIYEGLLRYGRPEPDYSRSDATTVTVRLSRAEADLAFLQMIIEEEERTQRPLPLESLRVLSVLREQRRLPTSDLPRCLARSEAEVRGVVEMMVESGLVEARGAGRGRSYTLSARVYRSAGRPGEYVRQAGFDGIQQEQMVLQYLANHGSIRRRDVMDMCRLDENQATYLLARLVRQRRARLVGRGRGAHYVLP